MERRQPTDEELAIYLVRLLEYGCRRFTLAEKEGLVVPDSSELTDVEPNILKVLEDLRGCAEGYEAEMLEGVDYERFAFEMKIFFIFAAMKALVGRGEKLFWAFHREAARLLFNDESKVHIAFMILGDRYSEYWDALCSEPQTMAFTRAFLKNAGAREAHPGTLFRYNISMFLKLKMIREMVVESINEVTVEGNRIGM